MNFFELAVHHPDSEGNIEDYRGFIENACNKCTGDNGYRFAGAITNTSWRVDAANDHPF